MNAAELAVYFALVLGVVLLPGVDMAFVVGWTLARGWRGGTAALAGVVAGALCHLTMGALGLALLIKAIPGAFVAMMIVGALYLVWLGWGLMRAEPTSAAVTESGSASLTSPEDTVGTVDPMAPMAPRGPMTRAEPADLATRAAQGRRAGRAGARGVLSVFGGAVLTNLMNPKAYLFSLAVLPQFLHPERGGLVWQLGAIGAVTALTQIAVYGGLALMATAGHQRLRNLSAFQQRLLMRSVALLLWAMALYTLYSGWQFQGAGGQGSPESGPETAPPAPFTRAA